MNNFFAEQSLLNNLVTIDEQRQTLNKIVEYFKKNEEGYEAMVDFVADLRGFPPEVIRDSDAFFINEDTPISAIPEEYQHDTYGICNGKRVIYAGRCIFPVKDVKGNVMGFCGWDNVMQPKYLDSKNYGYKAKANTFYGMEKLSDYYRSNKSVIVVEGLMDCLLLRYLGVQAFATLGSSLNGYVVTILKRFGDRLIVIPDNDNFQGTAEGKTAGESFVQQVFYKLPTARVYQTVNFKDLNDVWRDDNHREALIEDINNIDNMFYFFKEIIQRGKPKWRGRS